MKKIYTYRKFFHRFTILTKEQKMLGFFVFLLILLRIRLFFLQAIYTAEYQKDLIDIHATKSTLNANRGHIYTVNKGGKLIKLTENIDYYTIFVDPQFVTQKSKVVEILTPFVYQHLCQLYGISIPTKQECLMHIEKFTRKQILPTAPRFFYQTGSNPLETGMNTELQEWYDKVVIVEQEKYDQVLSGIINSYSANQIQNLISTRIDELIKPGKREFNYIGFFDNEKLHTALSSGAYPYIMREGNYIYIKPSIISNSKETAQHLLDLFQQYGYTLEYGFLLHQSQAQENNYVQIMSDTNLTIANQLMKIKTESINQTGSSNDISLLHGLGFEKKQHRYYPYGSFMAHILGFVDEDYKGHYGIEEYFQELLGGKNGTIVGLAGQGIGTVGTNDFIIQSAVDGKDIVLTIDPVIQQMTEQLAKQYTQEFLADSIAITIMDPQNGEIKSLTNYPTFNPNSPNKEYELIPLEYDHKEILDNITYLDHPIFIQTGDQLKLATSAERTNPIYRKYINKNKIGAQVFIDKNIASAYEPGSIFKPITASIGLDSDIITLQDTYFDKGYAEIGPYKISNVDKRCIGENNFLRALMYSCNVGMINVVKQVDMPIFYNYLEKIGFGQMTYIELAGEHAGFVPEISSVSKTQFLNNSFGQGISTTPIQIAVAYSTLVNGGILVKPTIVKHIQGYQPINNENLYQGSQIFKSTTSDTIKEALYKVVYEGQVKKFSIPGYTLAGKTGTSQIAYKGKYQKGLGWTNGSFAGIITKDHLNYVVIIQVRRPRTNERGETTAGKIYGDIAKFLIQYDAIES